MSNDPLAAQIATLRNAFLAQLPERIRLLEEALQRLGEDETAARGARLIVHNLTGAGATFGCPEISVAARSLEQAICLTGAAEEQSGPDVRAHIPELMNALKSAADSALATPSDWEVP